MDFSKITELTAQNECETEKIGEDFAKSLKAGDIVAMYGGMGMGKTAFTRGIARGLGISDRVTSPTYAIVNEYYGNLSLFHFDLFRLSGADELFDIGFDDYLTRGGTCVIEWFENAEGAYSPDYEVHISQGIDESERKIIIKKVK
ncbi:MAG: tRNA (adenosine(37)-N6)-threonylcarbamoyltransferase complex ATPase subunit type 1 TsaE [Clostridia bacterium]|nr:tRNA (adenosine(37)-N6)-threonylcarbamoyltransferase complex ATPase subunit type 1 TsaE [Clostridia bacterium]